ncbi:TPA: hypothetical protein SLV11_005841 [Pseudomonas aeruginosa]|nr:hypothetical protein [Pseudomonas aeruginosa]
MSNEDWNELDESYRSALSGALETAHPVVEQAGGDERAAFNAWLNEVTYEENTDRGVFKVQRHQTLSVDDERIAWRAWQGRALLARSEQEEMERLREAYERGYGDGQNNPNGYSDKKERDACVNELLKQPSTAQADEHRPTYECTMGIGGGDGNLFVHGDHASIKAAQQIVLERDAALAEVERLRESKGDPVGSLEKCMKVMYERDEHAKRLEAALARVAELEAKLSDPTAVHQWQFSNAWFDCSEEALLKAGKEGSPIRTLYTAPAQAQHSVPEGFREKFEQCMELAFAEITMHVSPDKCRDPESRPRKASRLATELRAMLAAAAGKEVGHE